MSLPESDAQAIVRDVESWINTMVVGLNLCPFAAPVLKVNGLRTVVSHSTTVQTLIDDIKKELTHLSNHDEIRTTVIAVPSMLLNFEDYLEFVSLLDEYIDVWNWRGVYQLATFHPDYRFEGTSEDDAANYTNRAPYPLLHILREDDVSAAIEAHTDTLAIPDRNIALLRELGRKKIEAMMTAGSGDS